MKHRLRSDAKEKTSITLKTWDLYDLLQPTTCLPVGGSIGAHTHEQQFKL